jgi:HSP20 family protein
MAFFPRSFVNEDSSTSFTPLFRLLSDFDNFSRGVERPLHSQMKSFVPKFDVKELKAAYELHGELPGIEQKDIEIEFTDDQTLTVKGRVARSYTSGTPPAGFVEGPAAHGAITEGESGKHKEQSHKTTVEDENAGEDSLVKQQTEVAAKAQQEPSEKFWVSERSVGEFSRSFSFPVRVDQDNVRASMKNGILSIVVPKAKKVEGRKITIA